jgi:hypothetical protein
MLNPEFWDLRSPAQSDLEAPSKSHGISIVTFWLDIRTFLS